MTADPRTLALLAFARGWLRAEDLWDVARLAGDDDASRALLGRLVTTDRLATLLDVAHADPTIVSDTAPSVTPVGGHAARYVIGAPLGSGGAGDVVAATDVELERVVAMKTLRGREGELAFAHEVRLTAGLEHPNIVPIYDVGVLSSGQSFYTMRIVPQRSLRDVLQHTEERGAGTVPRLRVIAQICRALAYAHARSIIHRDVKPGNILVGDSGEVYLADWGLATRFPVVDAGVQRVLCGTPGYIPPEIILGRWKEVGPASDLFAVGCVLYEAICGDSPFRRATTEATLASTTLEDPMRPCTKAPAVPAALDELCMSLLAKDAAARPADASAVADALDDVVSAETLPSRAKIE